jgi:zinc protease
VIGGYFVSLSTTQGLAETILADAQRGLDPSWLDAYPKAIRALTRDQVNAAIKAHINPNNMVLVEAGSVPGAKSPN